MVPLLLAAMLVQFADRDIESLIRDLDHELLEVREQARRRLIEIGPATIQALEAVDCSGNAELKWRIDSILEIVGREARERAHDQEQRDSLLRLHRNEEAERQPGSAGSGGARFDLSVTPHGGDRVLTTSVLDYLVRRKDRGPGQGFLEFDLTSVADESGRELSLERCHWCSPRKVLVKGGAGALVVRIRGTQTWFSPYEVEFRDPVVGQTKPVGAFKITVQEDRFTVEAPFRFGCDWIRSMRGASSYELKPGVSRPANPYGAGCGPRVIFGGTYRTKGKSWCNCSEAPAPPQPRSDSPFTMNFEALKPFDQIYGPRDASAPRVPHPTLADHARITFTFWKPIRSTIDLKIDVPAR